MKRYLSLTLIILLGASGTMDAKFPLLTKDRAQEVTQEAQEFFKGLLSLSFGTLFVGKAIVSLTKLYENAYPQASKAYTGPGKLDDDTLELHKDFRNKVLLGLITAMTVYSVSYAQDCVQS